VLRVPCKGEFLIKEIATGAMRIAVVCPNFTFMDIPPKHRKAFSQEIAAASTN
ncbi:hypothetical protein IWW57_006318, partial [Coemansia sp. S610]